jgi:hypothetical protein
MFYPLADCSAERREHAVVQGHWAKAHQTRVHPLPDVGREITVALSDRLGSGQLTPLRLGHG